MSANAKKLDSFSGTLQRGQVFVCQISHAPFQFEVVSSLVRLEEFLQECGRGSEFKIVGVGKFTKEVESAIQSQGFIVQKSIERNSSCELVFDGATGRLQASKEVQASTNAKVRVLIVDDSATIQKLLKKILEESPKFEVVGIADRPSKVEALIKECKPDVITMDIHMPEEDGVTLHKRLFPKYRIPTIMVTAIGLQEGRQVLEALEHGAVDYIQKPDFSELGQIAPMLREKILAASSSKVSFKKNQSNAVSNVELKENCLVVIGSSTGGTEALRRLLTSLPEKIPPILIVQHIPAVFSKAFADRMSQLCKFPVLEAEDGMEVIPGRVLVAPGGCQMFVKKITSKWLVKVDDKAEHRNRHKPSVDVLFDSVASHADSWNGVGVILTGMGADGADGLVKLKNCGWYTLTQDEESSVVYGMPKEAFLRGGSTKVCSLDEMAREIMNKVKK